MGDLFEEARQQRSQNRDAQAAGADQLTAAMSALAQSTIAELRRAGVEPVPVLKSYGAVIKRTVGQAWVLAMPQSTNSDSHLMPDWSSRCVLFTNGIFSTYQGIVAEADAKRPRGLTFHWEFIGNPRTTSALQVVGPVPDAHYRSLDDVQLNDIGQLMHVVRQEYRFDQASGTKRYEPVWERWDQHVAHLTVELIEANGRR